MCHTDLTRHTALCRSSQKRLPGSAAPLSSKQLLWYRPPFVTCCTLTHSFHAVMIHDNPNVWDTICCFQGTQAGRAKAPMRVMGRAYLDRVAKMFRRVQPRYSTGTMLSSCRGMWGSPDGYWQQAWLSVLVKRHQRTVPQPPM